MSFPRWIPWVVPAALCALFLTPRAHAEHFDVVILIGQSKMDGRGQAKDLVGPLEKYNRPQSDVKIDYSCSDLRGPALSSEGWQPEQVVLPTTLVVRGTTTTCGSTAGR